MVKCGFRRTLLCPVLLFILLSIVIYEFLDLGDSGMFIDVLTLMFSSICLCIWLIWWFRSTIPPSIMFKITCLLIGSNVVVLAFQTYARWVLLHDVRWYLHFVQGDLWTYRYAPCLFVFIWLFAWVVGRIFGLDDDYITPSVFDEGTLNVLLVEDDPAYVYLIKRMLDEVGYFSVTISDSSKDARSKFIPGKYACILLDLNLGLGVSDGMQLADDFRQLDKLAVIAIISGYPEHILDKRLVSTTDDFLRKPFGVEELRDHLFNWIVCYRKRVQNKKERDNANLSK